MKACMEGKEDEYESCKTEFIQQEIILLQRNQRNTMYKHYYGLAWKPSFAWKQFRFSTNFPKQNLNLSRPKGFLS